MEKIIYLDSWLSTIINLVILVIMLSVFILVFFFPEVAGEIGAVIVKSFQTHIK